MMPPAWKRDLVNSVAPWRDARDSLPMPETIESDFAEGGVHE
jgi:hypothetical protein